MPQNSYFVMLESVIHSLPGVLLCNTTDKSYSFLIIPSMNFLNLCSFFYLNLYSYFCIKFVLLPFLYFFRSSKRSVFFFNLPLWQFYSFFQKSICYWISYLSALTIFFSTERYFSIIFIRDNNSSLSFSCIEFIYWWRIAFDLFYRGGYLWFRRWVCCQGDRLFVLLLI